MYLRSIIHLLLCSVFSLGGREGGEVACWGGWFSSFLGLVQYSRMFQILGISYVGWICAWWSTINIWCVYVLDMGVCASSGSVGFWPIIPAALRSQLRSHAHIWHSFLDMITIHLPLRVWLCGIFPSFPSGTGATFQKWTARPTATTPYSLVFILSLPPHCLLLVQHPPPSQLFVSADMIGSFGSDIFSLTSC